MYVKLTAGALASLANAIVIADLLHCVSPETVFDVYFEGDSASVFPHEPVDCYAAGR